MEKNGYVVNNPESIETPAFLVFTDRVEHNIQSIIDLVGGPDRLMPHIKTHKSIDILKKQMGAGITGFKCATLREAEMIAEGGGNDILISYPVIQGKKIKRLMGLKKKHPSLDLKVTIDNIGNVDDLAEAASEARVRLGVMLDLDVGMHRTGIATGEEALKIYRHAYEKPDLEVRGIHSYDGHNLVSDTEEREKMANECLKDVREMADMIRKVDLKVPSIVMGGSFTYHYFAREDGIKGSPGTWIYWDATYSRGIPDMPFQWAGLVLSQVIDHHPSESTVTLDIGSKAISADPLLKDRLLLLGYENIEPIRQNEEHIIIRIEGERPQVGDHVLAIPGHVCTTVVKYPGAWAVDKDGEVEKFYPHTARDRW